MSEVGSFLVHIKSKDIELRKSNFIKFLKEEGYEVSKKHNWTGHKMHWVWVNINDMEYHMPKAGVEVVPTIGKHALTEEEFYIINDIYKRYDGLNPLEFKN